MTTDPLDDLEHLKKLAEPASLRALAGAAKEHKQASDLLELNRQKVKSSYQIMLDVMRRLNISEVVVVIDDVSFLFRFDDEGGDAMVIESVMILYLPTSPSVGRYPDIHQ